MLICRTDLDDWPNGEPSPGVLGCGFLLAGATLESWRQHCAKGAVFEGVWWTECPLCQQRAELHGPAVGDPWGDGWFYCEQCHREALFCDDEPGALSMSPFFARCINGSIFGAVEVPSDLQSEAVTVTRRALKLHIETTSGKAAKKVLALLAEGAFSETVPDVEELTALAVWLKQGCYLGAPPQRLVLQVLDEHRSRLASAVVMAAAERLSSRTGAAWFVATELYREEPEAMVVLGNLLDWSQNGDLPDVN